MFAKCWKSFSEKLCHFKSDLISFWRFFWEGLENVCEILQNISISVFRENIQRILTALHHVD